MSQSTISVYLPAIFGLIGVLVGALVSALVTYSQSKTRDRRDRLTQATSLALEEHKARMELAKRQGVVSNVLPPITVVIQYYVDVLAAIERDNLNEGEVDRIIKKSIQLDGAIRRRDRL
jgi:hypothetical protein